jgi:CDGSH-type Zn-finger protein
MTAADRTHEPAATVTAYPDGPLLLRGDFELRDADGTVIDCRQRAVALCRCGRSALAPFCDGTHKAGRSVRAARRGAREDQ